MTDTLVAPSPTIWNPSLVERPELAVERPPTTPPKSKRAMAVVPLVVVVTAAWLIASFWTSVETRSPRQPFLAPTAGQSWIRSPEPGPHAFFRLDIPIDVIPQSATLWFTADQAAEPYVNGGQLADTPRVQTYNGTYVPRVVETFDLRPSLVVGANVIGLEVINYDNRAPAFQAHIRIQSGGDIQTYGVTPSDWRSTTNVALTGQSLPRSGAFATTALIPTDWVPATASRHRVGATTVPIAPASYSTPATGDAIVGGANGKQLNVSTTVNFPPGCTNGWMRIATNGPYTVSLDGRIVASGTGTWQALGVPKATTWAIDPLKNTIPLTIYDLCPVESAGPHRLSVSVISPTAPVVYLDGSVDDGSTVVRFMTGPGWTASGYAQPDLVANPERLLDATLQTTAGTTSVPSGPLFLHTITLFLLLLGLGCAAGLVAGALGVRRRQAMGAVAAGALPALGLVLVLSELRHFIGVQPPFPSTPFVLRIVFLLAAGGVALSVALTRYQLSRASARPPGRHVKKKDSSFAGPYRRDTPAARPALIAWLRIHRYGIGITSIAVFWVLVLSYRIDYQPVWQDEFSSIAAAQGIAAHLVPRWPSGFLYWKSELYSALLAIVGTLSHYRTSWIREFSTLWFGATVLLFGFRLIPLAVPGRRVFQWVGTLAFASAVFEQSHAQEIRMYQMVQFFVVLLAIILLKTVREPSTARIAAVMGVTVCMYLSHEESFGVLLLVPLALFGFLGFRWCRDWRWWIFGGLASLVIVVQVALAELTHPPAFGVDLSGGPLVQWSPKPFFYLANVFFTPGGPGPALTVVSLLAVIGTVIGWRSRDRALLYLAAFWIVPVVVVSLFLPAKNPRYVFITLPFEFILASRACAEIFSVLCRAVSSGEQGVSRLAHRMLTLVFAGACGLAVMMSTVGSLSDYGPLAQVLFGANVQHSNLDLDYPDAVDYVKAHEHKGDAVIAVGPANLTGGSLGRAPTYWLSANRTQTLLYVFEKNNQVVDTQFGVPVLLNINEFETAIDAHPRTWLVVADQNASRLVPSMRGVVINRFRMVYEGESVSVFLCTN
jgi:hypothetical protein